MAEDLGSTGADLALAPPSAEIQAAMAKKSELMADAGWRDRYLSGDPAARSEMSGLNGTIVGANSNTISQPEAHEVEHLRSAGVSEEIVQQFIKRDPIPEGERAIALQWKASHLRDRAWLDKYNNGDIEARRQMATCNMLLTLPVKPAA
jgi:hypothetical protein